MNILVAYGTRPEVIKLFPLLEILKCKTLYIKQHTSLINDVKDLVPKPDYICDIGDTHSLNDIIFSTSYIKDINISEFDVVLIVGDTASALSISLLAFNSKVKIGHIEAGLRTYNLSSPYPEECYRQIIDRISDYNFCPSQISINNLKSENVHGESFLTGNTSIDAVKRFQVECNNPHKILITLHRRENELDMRNIFKQIDNIAKQYPEYDFVFPAHPNPIVRNNIDVFKFVRIIKPLSYKDMIRTMCESKLVISDSGGIQEEITYLKKPIIVCRDTTERPEVISLGFGRLSKNNIEECFRELINNNISSEAIHSFPYGVGNSSDIINEILWSI